MNHIKTHEDFFNMVNDTGSILKFLIENNICSKRSKCPNKKCKKPRKNILSLKNERLFYKCNSFGCSRWWSANNNIFNFKTKSQLSVKQILSIIWFYCHSFKLKDVIMQTGIARKHIIKWWCKILSAFTPFTGSPNGRTIMGRNYQFSLNKRMPLKNRFFLISERNPSF